MSRRAALTHRLAVIAWLLLVGSVAAWPFCAAGIDWPYAAVGLLPLFLPLPGLVGRSGSALRAAPLALAPVLALSLTEIVANPPARACAGVSLALTFVAFAAVIAAIRASTPR